MSESVIHHHVCFPNGFSFFLVALYSCSQYLLESWGWSRQLPRLTLCVYKPGEFPNRDNIFFCPGPWLHWRSCPGKEFCHLFPGKFTTSDPEISQHIGSRDGNLQRPFTSSWIQTTETILHLKMFTSFWKSHPVSLPFFQCLKPQIPWILTSPQLLFFFFSGLSLSLTLNHVLIMSSESLTWRLSRL